MGPESKAGEKSVSLGGASGSGWWVTVAANDEDAHYALQLLASIRGSRSTKEVAIIYDGGTGALSPDVKSALVKSFDYALEMSESDFGGGGRPTTATTQMWSTPLKLVVSAWKLCACKRAVFLHPATLFLDNCDELFATVDDGEFCACPTNSMTSGAARNSFGTSLFVFKPNLTTFAELVKSLESIIVKTDLGMGLNAYFGEKWSPLGSEYASKLINTVDSAVRGKIVQRHELYHHQLTGNKTGTGAKAVEPIAIVGLACRFPGANNQDEFWELLHEGRDLTAPLPESRAFTRQMAGGTVGLGTVETPAGYLKADIDAFDAKFFHISRREAEYMDPQQRLLLEVAWESLENAGIDPHSLAGSNSSVYVGMWSQEYAIVSEGSLVHDSHFQYLGNAFCASSARISHFLGTHGPAITMEAGCAASLEAVHYACEALRGGGTDLVICGGVNIALKPSSVLGSLDSFVLSKDGKCKTFDVSANGFARSEAVVVLILKRLSCALRDSNNVLGLLAGSAVSSDGAGATGSSSMGTPNPGAQEMAIRGALAAAGISPSEISYVEAHGTGTPVGDPLEFQALNAVFGNDSQRGSPLIVGSVKTNIGHTEGASGLAGLVKVLLAMRARRIPRHLNLVQLNPAIDLTRIPAVIPSERELGWKPCGGSAVGGGLLVAGVSSFGLSGTNVHVIVQEPPLTPALDTASNRVDRGSHILTLSATSEVALSELAAAYVSLLEKSGGGNGVSLPDLAFSANTGRAQLPHRLAIVCSTTADLLSKLKRGPRDMTGKIRGGDKSLKIGFLFTGQGSQYVGMATELYDTAPYFKQTLDSCGQLLRVHHSLDLHSILRDRHLVHEHSQVALFCVGFALASLWQSFGIRPDFVLGHSVGEFAAAVLAGLISLEHGLKLVVERARLVRLYCSKGAMLVVKAPTDKTKSLISEFLANNKNNGSSDLGRVTSDDDDQVWMEVAASNSNEETVISGPPTIISHFEEYCAGLEVKTQTQRLSANHAFHSRAMDPILDEYHQFAASLSQLTPEEAVEDSTARLARRPKFISATLAKEVESGLDASYWVTHLREPVAFADAIALLTKGDTPPRCDVLIEIGPQPILLPLAMSLVSSQQGKSADGFIWAPSLRRNESNWSTLLTSLGRLYTGGLRINWAKLDAEYERVRIQLPTYPFQREKYWHGHGGGSEDSDDNGRSSVQSLTVHSGLLHPLLGRRVPCPSSELVCYVNSLRMDDLAWVRDHKVGGRVVLPAAAYLELVQAAGADMIGGGQSGVYGGRGRLPIPLAVQQLVVESALPLSDEDGPAVHIQTTVTTERVKSSGESDDDAEDADTQLKYKVTVYKQTRFESASGADAGTWRKLVSATLVPAASMIDPTLTKNIDIDSLRCSLTLRPTASQDIYTTSAKLGLTFGPNFKSIHQVWGVGDVILVETSLPSPLSARDSGFTTHPILLDAMIQSLTTLRGDRTPKTQLELPVGIESYLCMNAAAAATSSSSWTDKMYIVVTWPPPPPTSDTPASGARHGPSASLYNARGELLGLMEGVDMIQTSIDSFLESLRTTDHHHTHRSLYPSFYDDIWFSRLGPNERRLQPSTAFKRFLDDDGDEGAKNLLIKAVPTFRDNYGAVEGYAQVVKYPSDGMAERVDQLVYLYILKSLRQLGWPVTSSSTDPGIGNSVSLSDLMASANILPGHGQLFRRWFQILEEEGDVQLSAAASVLVERCIPGQEEIEERLQECIATFVDDVRALDCQYIMNFGEQLSSLIQGKCSPFGLLFPDEQHGGGDGEQVGAATLYTQGPSAPIHKAVVHCLRALIHETLPLHGGGRGGGPVLRILEVGGGTGSMTSLLFQELDSHPIEYEYTFTDISPHFLKLASARFGSTNTNVQFKLLDIETDPKRQGFVPHSYDVVVADLVLHATQSLAESVGNVRSLLVPSGVLLLVELVTRARMLDISFGFLDGWWRFKDHSLRPDYPCISSADWAGLLRASHFSRVIPIGKVGAEDDPMGLIVAFADEKTGFQANNWKSDSMSGVWLLFGTQNNADDYDTLTQHLKKQLEAVGEKVLVVVPSEVTNINIQPDDKEFCECELNIQDEDGYVRLLDALMHSGLHLRGVVYMWAMGGGDEFGTLLDNKEKDHNSILTPLIDSFTYMTRSLLRCRHFVDSPPFNVYCLTAGMQSVSSESDPILSDPLYSVIIGILSTVNNETAAGHAFVNIDLEPNTQMNKGTVARDVFAELWTTSHNSGGRLPELYIAFRQRVKWVRRIVENRVEYVRPLQLPPTERYTLLNPDSGSFSDFKIVPATKQQLEGGQIEVAVRAASLNFKDVLVALSSTDSQELLDGGGVVADGHVQDVVKELGLDFAGVVTRTCPASRHEAGLLRVGDRVFGFTPGGLGGALASHVVVPAANVCLMPAGSSFESQAALPAILLTVHYFLVQKAQIRSEDRVLVHTGSGGVGLLAIQVAQAFGAEVYATAGSVRKRAYLRHFMNVRHVYSSRSTDFGAHILKDTEGKGVNIVLNSLTGPGFKEASLSACAPFARFLEMSKLNIWSAEQVQDLRPDVSYFVQDVSRLMGSMRSYGSNQDNQLLHEAFGNYQEVFHFWKELSERKPGHDDDRSSFVLRELPVTRFTLTRVHDAFRYLQSARHIGKVIIKMPVTSVQAGAALVHKEELFNEFGTYLITGGLGGLGLEVAKWMAGSGAKYLVLMSRSPPNKPTEALIDHLRRVSSSVQVLVVQGDVGELAACERMLQEIEAAGFPAVRGIMHAAGVIPGVGKDKDNPDVSPALGKQTTATYLTACRPKVHGTWNLHLLTLRHNLTLDHFVLFSSVVTTLGGFGQANYVAANRYLDAFVGYRRSLGLPCSSISWGSWSDVGAAKEFVIGMARAFGLQHFTPSQGIASLERVLLSHRPSAIVVNISNAKLVKQTVRQGRLLEYINEQAKTSLTSDWYERKIREIHDAEPGGGGGDGRTELIKEYLEAAVRSALKLHEAETIDPDTDLRELGVDSLMSMELRSKLHSLLKDVKHDREVTITLQSFMECRTLNKLAELATEMLNDRDGANGRSKCLNNDQLLALVQKDCALPEEIRLPTTSSSSLSVPSDWKHVLLTGATGQLGIFILSELTRRGPHLIVHCLIRAKSHEAAKARLRETLANYNLLETTDLDRVVCVAADVSLVQLGLSDHEYGALANTIDAVIHSAAKVNHVALYGEFGPEDLRSTNVNGLLNVLRFVVTGKVKPLQFESTNGIVPIVQQEENAAECDRLETRLPDGYWGQAVFSHGYFLSKFVCEKLLHEAALRRGLQITCTRHNYLATTADTKSGLLAAGTTNHALLLALACQRVKAVPDINVHLTMVPASAAGRVSASLFLDDRAWASTPTSGGGRLGIYAINNPASIHVSDLRDFLCKMGAETRLLPYEKWRQAVLGFGGGTTTELAPLADFYTPDLFSSALVTKSEIWRQLTSKKPDLSNSDKLKVLVPNIDQLMPHPLELMVPYLDRYEALIEKRD